METKKGQISVTTENIFPIIRQWLYEDQDIFIRELVSNCADAIAKFKRLVELGNAEAPEDGSKYEIWVRYDDDAKVISFEDNGIGMTAEEVEKYINQIAFSGALDFVNKFNEVNAAITPSEAPVDQPAPADQETPAAPEVTD